MDGNSKDFRGFVVGGVLLTPNYLDICQLLTVFGGSPIKTLSEEDVDDICGGISFFVKEEKYLGYCDSLLRSWNPLAWCVLSERL